MQCEMRAHECTCGASMEARAEVCVSAGLCPPEQFFRRGRGVIGGLHGRPAGPAWSRPHGWVLVGGLIWYGGVLCAASAASAKTAQVGDGTSLAAPIKMDVHASGPLAPGAASGTDLYWGNGPGRGFGCGVPTPYRGGRAAAQLPVFPAARHGDGEADRRGVGVLGLGLRACAAQRALAPA